MRTWCVVFLAAGAALAQAARPDPERILADRFHFTVKELGQARQGAPVVKVETESTELSIVGAIRLTGRKARLADWIKNIQHFRKAAELGSAHVLAMPATADALAGVPLDTPELRDTLAARANAYAGHGNDAAMQALAGRVAIMTDLAAPLVAYLQRYPASRPEGVDELFYWSVMPVGSESITSVHHLVVYRPGTDQVWIADKNVYATKYVDAGIIAIALYDAADGTGFYAVAGSRIMSSQLSGVAATVLRRQVQRAAADWVKTYLEWIRDSLALAS
jgi:hypothetical protein